MPHVDPDRLLLLALGEHPPDPADTDHLAACARCREDLDANRQVVTLARDSQDLQGLPSPSEVLWDRITAEAFPATTATTTTTVPHPRRGSGGSMARWRTGLIAVAALVVGIFGTAGLGHVLSDDGPAPRVLASAELIPQAAAPGTAHGRAQVIDTGHGWQVVVTVEGMPATPGYYTVWIYDGGSVMIPLGSPGSAPLNVPAAARDLSVFHVVDVSAQALGQQQHGRSVLQGTLK